MCAEVADQGRKQRSYPAPPVVREPLSRSTQGDQKKLSKKSSHRTERARGKKSERKTEKQHHMVADGQYGVEQNRRKRQHREKDECPFAAYPIGQVRRCQI